jgi:tRNA pseudouridine38-40 synthase
VAESRILDKHATARSFITMAAQSLVLLVLHYDGADFSGWQRQASARTVQGVMEDTLARLCDAPVRVTGAGRTDAGVHARGQAAGAQVPERWRASELRRALNSLLPADIWVQSATAMLPEFHPRFSAISRSYNYYVGTSENSRSPFRSRYEWGVEHGLDHGLLSQLAQMLSGEKVFRGFAVHGSAREGDDYRCVVRRASWVEAGDRLVFQIEANRFLRHMVRFRVSTMVDIASGKREVGVFGELLAANSNSSVSAPAPAHGLFLESVSYPPELYRDADK